MATHWLREVSFQNGSPRAGISFQSKLLCWWMYNILGYTNFAQSVSSGSYDPTGAATGTNGALSNANFNLVDSTYGAFAAGDVGKWVLIKDLTNPSNSGWYLITAFVDANTVTIDFRSGASEYPTTASSLSWWMIAEDANLPDTVGDYWRLRTPHTDAWEIEFELESNYLRVRVSLNADWTGSGKILQTATPTYKVYGYSGNTDASQFFHYAEGNTEGSRLNIWWFSTYNPAGNGSISVAKIVPFESGHAATELWMLAGPTTVGSWNAQNITRGGNDTTNWNGLVWRERDASVNFCQPLEWSHADYANGFTQWGSNEINARTSKNDLKPGTTFIVDKLNADDKYEVMGEYPAFEECRNNFNALQTIDDAGTKDKIMVHDGFVAPWPGVTPQFVPL